jgi:hypothetical protein
LQSGISARPACRCRQRKRQSKHPAQLATKSAGCADFPSVIHEFCKPPHRASGANPVEIRRAATECLRRVQLNRKLRLLGVRVSALTPASAEPARPLPVQADLPFANDE